MKKKSWLNAIILTVMIFVLLFTPAALASDNSTFDDLSVAKIYARLYAYYQLDAAALDAPDMQTLVSELAKVDPYSKYMTAAELEAYNNRFDPSYTGIGVLLEKNDAERVAIKAVFADSMAASAGFLRGDIIYSVDGTLTEGMSAKEVGELLQGAENQLLTVEIERNGYVVKYEMKRKTMSTPSAIYWMLDDQTAYMLIERFNIQTGAQIAAAMEYLGELGMKSLLLDLRDCPGGVMQAAGYTAGVLGEDGPIYFNMGKDGYESFYVSKEDGEDLEIPIAVLVNEKTASAAEMLAAVLQDTDRAMIVGTPTFGKGVYQSLLVLPSGAGLYFTTGKYITRGYQDITELGGVTPDLLVRDSAAQDDTALTWLKKQQALAHNFIFIVGNNHGKADGISFYLYHAPLISSSSAYLPMGETLDKMGWQLYYYDNCWYGFNGTRRVIIDLAEKEIISGNHSSNILIRNNSVYLPAAFFRNLGYAVTWDGAARSVTVTR